MRVSFKYLLTALLPFYLACQTQVSFDKEGILPERTSHLTKKHAVFAKELMVSSAHPEATRAGLKILKKGGTAIDAAVAVQMVLNLVEPQSSGIGGGLFLLYYDKKTNTLVSIDGRETAPDKIDPNVFLNKKGRPLTFRQALIGGKSVGTPGVLAALRLAHGKYGKLKWADLFLPAIELARTGFYVSPRLHQLIKETPWLKTSPTARQYFYTDTGQPLSIGERLQNTALAQTFETIAGEGAQSFYEGHIAHDIVAAVRTAYVDPGALTLKDLATYKAKTRKPVCATYRVYKVCGMGPPSSGGIAVLQILGILENFDLKKLKPLSVGAIHLFSEASKLAFADRARYLADSDLVAVPVKALIDKGYLKQRAQLIGNKSMGRARAGQLANPKTGQWADDASPSFPSTSHFSIVDRDGNAVAVTSSIEHGFGSTLMVDGFLLNNQLTDFSFVSKVKGRPVANRIEPGKRPRSSMAPTMVFDKNGKLVLLVGSAGGAYIIEHVAQTLIGVLDWGMDIQQAINLPHYANRNGDVELEKGTDLEKLKGPLEKLGHKVKIRDLNSGLHGIMITKDGLVGGADPRREGVVLGE